MKNLCRNPADKNKYYLKENGEWENYCLQKLSIKGRNKWKVIKYIPAILDKNENEIEDSKVITIAIRSTLNELDKRLTFYKKNKH